MVISDKQTLRRCVKQAVRRTEVVETLLYFDICNGEMGIKTLAETFSQSEGSTPFQADAVAAYAAMEALDMPIDDMHRAALIQSGYTREAYLREILDVMHARRVLPVCPFAKLSMLRLLTIEWRRCLLYRVISLRRVDMA